jgi:hypothetical protein
MALQHWIPLALALALPLAQSHASLGYSLDLIRPANVPGDFGLGWLPTRVSVYLRGPTTGVDKSDALGGPFSFGLVNATPDWSATNSVTISNLLSALVAHNYQDKIPNVAKHKGCTYHILLFDDASHTAMHFRVFLPTDISTPWCFIHPRSDTGFAYFNDQIGSWLTTNLTHTATHPREPEKGASPGK